MGYMCEVLGNYTITGPMSESDVLAAAEDILRGQLERQGAIGSPRDSAAFLRMHLGSLPHEEFHAVWLDTRHQILAVDRLFDGTSEPHGHLIVPTGRFVGIIWTQSPVKKRFVLAKFQLRKTISI